MQKLIKLNTHHYIIVDDSEIKYKDWYLDDTNQVRMCVVLDTDYWKSRKEYKKITHSTNIITNGTGILYLSEVKELIGEVDVKKKGENYSTTHEDVSDKLEKYLVNVCFQDGYYTALEDNKEKKYTEEDMWKAFEYGKTLDGYDWFGDLLESLQPKTEWEVEIVDGKLKLV